LALRPWHGTVAPCVANAVAEKKLQNTE